MFARFRLAVLSTLVIGANSITHAHSQTWGPLPSDSEMRSSWTGEVSTSGINAVLGGLTAGIARHHRDGRFWNGFAHGALAGGIGYAGKRISVERWEGAGLVGRGVNAVGASMIANAGEGQPSLSRVSLPVGPVRVLVAQGGGPALRARLDLASVIAIGYALAQPDARLDVGTSLSAGAPVFLTRSPNPGYAPEGKHGAGVVMIEANEDEWRGKRERVVTLLAHERVHVLQHDLALQVWGAPMQRWLLARVPGGNLLDRYVDLGLHYPVWAGLNAVVPYDARPWEREAYFLSNRPSDLASLPGSAAQSSP